MALDGHESDLSTRLGYQYILPKSCRNVEDRKILMDIKNILPLDDQPTTVSCATFLSEPSSMHEHSVTNDQRSGQQSEYGISRSIFIVTLIFKVKVLSRRIDLDIDL